MNGISYQDHNEPIHDSIPPSPSIIESLLSVIPAIGASFLSSLIVLPTCLQDCTLPENNDQEEENLYYTKTSSNSKVHNTLIKVEMETEKDDDEDDDEKLSLLNILPTRNDLDEMDDSNKTIPLDFEYDYSQYGSKFVEESVGPFENKYYKNVLKTI